MKRALARTTLAFVLAGTGAACASAPADGADGENAGSNAAAVAVPVNGGSSQATTINGPPQGLGSIINLPPLEHACGALLQPPCDGACDTGLHPDPQWNGTCAACGGIGQPCCANFSLDNPIVSGYTACFDGTVCGGNQSLPTANTTRCAAKCGWNGTPPCALADGNAGNGCLAGMQVVDGMCTSCTGSSRWVGGQCLAPQPTQTYPVDVGFGIKRWVKKTCGSICVKSGPRNPKTGQVPCEEWFQTCGGQLPPTPVAVELFADQNAMNANADFPAYNQVSGWQYEGCGPQAALNVLSYYGVDKRIQDMLGYVSVYKFSDTNIASLPDNVAYGVRTMLNQWGDGNFTVTRSSGVDIRSTVRSQLLQGNPVIVLDKGGSHYQMVVGLSGGEYRVVDYAGNDAWKYETELDFTLSGGGMWGSIAIGGAGGYEAYTVVTVTRTPR